jgi:hypothetical protein
LRDSAEEENYHLLLMILLLRFENLLVTDINVRVPVNDLMSELALFFNTLISHYENGI